MVMRHLTALLSLLLLGGCAADGTDLDLPAATPLSTPAGPGAAQPWIAAGDGRLVLSWTEPAEAGHTLRFALWQDSAWTEPGTVASGADWFVNWADFPSVVPISADRMAAHWLQRSGPGRYSYDVMLVQSFDGGATWTEPLRPHRDGTETEHGFVSLFPLADSVGVVWLDGRRFADTADGAATNEMMLLATSLPATGMAPVEHRIDERVCDCCQTSAAWTSRGVLVAYRDRSPDEVRDIAYSTYADGRWDPPRLVHADDWVINACPVNGPAVAAAGDRAVIAWFTAARDTPRVQVAFSDDAGRTFGAPVRVDQGDPVGRVDVLLIDSDRAFIVWLERVGDAAEVRGRLVRASGEAGPPAAVAATSAGRSAGFPRMAALDGRVLLAWTETSEPSSVRAAILAFDR
jgi:hypothetical protein